MKTKMTPEAAARIQSATAKANHGKIAKGSVAAQAMSAAAKNLQDTHQPKKPFDEKAKQRIQRAETVAQNGTVRPNSFAAYVQHVVDSNNAGNNTPPNGPSKTGNPSGGGRGNNPPSKK